MPQQPHRQEISSLSKPELRVRLNECRQTQVAERVAQREAAEMMTGTANNDNDASSCGTAAQIHGDTRARMAVPSDAMSVSSSSIAVSVTAPTESSLETTPSEASSLRATRSWQFGVGQHGKVPLCLRHSQLTAAQAKLPCAASRSSPARSGRRALSLNGA